MRTLIAAAASLALAGPVFGQAAALTRIGAAAAVKGRVEAQAPGAPAGRVVESGKTLYLDDHVTTDAAGRLQVLLLDQTVFTLGPNSDMVLDKFVYDPATHDGTVAATVAKGAFRFVTGQIARHDPKSMTVKVPAGTIGIRGTIVIGEIAGDKTTIILGGPGSHGDTDESRGAFMLDGRMVEQPGYGVTCQGAACSGVRDLSDEASRINGLLAAALDSSRQNAQKGPPASERSGQKTASGRGDSLQQLVDQDAGQTQDALITTTANDPRGAQDGVSTWDELRNNPQLGSASYQSPTLPFACTGSGCSGATFNADFNLTVNFGARTYSSNISTTGGFGSDSGSANGNFSGLSGAAVIPYTSGNFSGSQIELVNAGGAVAKTAVMSFKWDNTITNASGSGTLSASRP